MCIDTHLVFVLGTIVMHVNITFRFREKVQLHIKMIIYVIRTEFNCKSKNLNVLQIVTKSVESVRIVFQTCVLELQTTVLWQFRV